MKGDTALVPVAHDREAVGAIAKEPVKLVGDDGDDASIANVVEHTPTSLARCERLAGADAGIGDDIFEAEAPHRAVGTNCRGLRVEAHAVRHLLLRADPRVRDDLLDALSFDHAPDVHPGRSIALLEMSVSVHATPVPVTISLADRTRRRASRVHSYGGGERCRRPERRVRDRRRQQRFLLASRARATGYARIVCG